MLIGIFLGLAAAGFQAAAKQPADGRRDVCELIAVEDIRAVQGATVKERKASEQNLRGLRFAQCLYATTDFARSVSLTVITASSPTSAASGGSYWMDTFHPQPKMAQAQARPARKKDPPRPVSGAGDEAFWTGDARAGALYVLRDDTVLRVSVGGASDEEDRIRLSKTLALAALNRLHRNP